MNKALEIGKTLNPMELHKDLVLREFHGMEEFHKHFTKNPKVWSWGAERWTRNKDWWLGFKVNGHHHSGYVYLCVNAVDLFTVILTTVKNKIVDVVDNVYLPELIDTIDRKVEYISEYENR
jgi:hypothetical protein